MPDKNHSSPVVNPNQEAISVDGSLPTFRKTYNTATVKAVLSKITMETLHSTVHF
ncbi:hypothetical protein [Thermoanaerobacterium saccharolyticum]|uniref:hypothetical protein n=1 Tax=Thermoanaerobacterium saccharolyticum TaxID=28896 RepID=UPI002FDB098B